MIIMMVVLALILAALGTPMWLIMAALGLTNIMYLKMPLSIVPQVMYGSVNEFVLLAVPLFILAGNLMGQGSLAPRLIAWVRSIIGNSRVGMPITVIGVSELFGTISGSAPATTAALGKVLYPGLRTVGYSERFSAGLLTSIGAISSIVPPSINMILFAATSNVSVARLFLAGIVPSFVIVALLIAYVVIYTRMMDKDSASAASGAAVDLAAADGVTDDGQPLLKGEEKKLVQDLLKQVPGGSRWRTFFSSTRQAFWALGTPVIIFGGIYSGVATPTEVASLACLYGLLVSVVFYREMNMQMVTDAFKDAAMMTARIFIITAAAGVFSWTLTVAQIPQTLVMALQGVDVPWWAVVALINVLLLVVGMFMDPISAILVFTPILMPISKAIGLDPVHFGTIVVVNLAIGMFTPPFGMNLFVASSIFKIPAFRIIRGLVPFIAIYTIGLFIISYIPSLSLWLPNLLLNK